jgi:hypothetical protein
MLQLASRPEAGHAGGSASPVYLAGYATFSWCARKRLSTLRCCNTRTTISLSAILDAEQLSGNSGEGAMMTKPSLGWLHLER